ncbi:YciE/YciF ferroxidase family protein [Natronolimnohabitans innermongolicus]|uniref:Uncharacterized protein n=1 Tax=Natronolimnohabitans innermongolicus JCM 12255 TaxID=1227499 RepID=L9X5T4_9EURY|nr:DUF892 family protein [Natronolimnohabitans innermongolicus]ELY55948.1 hypothetical protein C493_10733 [Natronolimnohabitans innermongolicus JCM 12255]
MSATTTAARDALTAQLERLYYIERTLQSELETLSNDVEIQTLDDIRALQCREQLQYAIDGHREETETHLERIERAFDALDEEPDGRPVPELDGLIADKEAFNNVVLNDALRPLYYMQTVLELEAIECTVYETTIALAGALPDDVGDEVVDALRDNYDDERELRTELEDLTESEAVRELLAASPIDDAPRESLDRAWRRDPDRP